MPSHLQIAGQDPRSRDVLIDVVGEEAVALAAAEACDRRHDVALRCNDPITPETPVESGNRRDRAQERRDRELRELDRLMRQRSTHDLGSAV